MFLLSLLAQLFVGGGYAVAARYLTPSSARIVAKN